MHFSTIYWFLGGAFLQGNRLLFQVSRSPISSTSSVQPSLKCLERSSLLVNPILWSIQSNFTLFHLFSLIIIILLTELRLFFFLLQFPMSSYLVVKSIPIKIHTYWLLLIDAQKRLKSNQIFSVFWYAQYKTKTNIFH